MRHHAKHAPILAQNARDISDCSIRARFSYDRALVIRILENDLALILQLFQAILVDEITTFAMGDRYFIGAILESLVIAARSLLGHNQIRLFTDKKPCIIAQESARQEMRFGKNLKPIANAEDRTAFGSKGFHSRHDRTETGKSPAAQVIAVAKTARKDDSIELWQRMLFMPDKFEIEIKEAAEGVDAIRITVGARKLNKTNLRVCHGLELSYVKGFSHGVGQMIPGDFLRQGLGIVTLDF